ARLGEHVAQAAQAPAVVLRRPLALAQADHQHLEDAALEAAAKIGVRLDARDGHHRVGFEGVFVPPDRLAPAVAADLPTGHVRFHGHAEVVLADAVLGEQLPLPFTRRAAVAAHRGDDERLRAQVAEAVEGRLHQHRDVLDAAAAAADGDAV